MKNYKEVIPRRFHEVSFENDVSENIKKIYKDQLSKRESLFIYGASGVGKSHIACALAKNLLENEIEVMYFNTGELLERLRAEYKDEVYDEDYNESLFTRLLDFNGVLILDDIGAEKTSDWVIERLYIIINKKYEDMVPMIFTSNCSIEELHVKIGGRIASRISGMSAFIKKVGEDRRIKK